MNLAVVFDLGLTTHGEGLEGARSAAIELVLLWVEAKRAAGEPVQPPPESLLSTLSIPSDAVQSP